MSKGEKDQLQAATTNQSGGSSSTSTFRQQLSVGEPFSTQTITTSRFRIVPGFLGSVLSASSTVVPVSDLDLQVLYAKTHALGEEITPETWQRDNDPIFLWEPPPTGSEVAGYSYAFDGEPDDTVDTVGTSCDVVTSPLKLLADGQHTFAVKALNSAGNSGKAISLQVWVDTTPPQISGTGPAAGALLNARTPSVSATISDPASGVSAATIQLFLNGSSLSISFDQAGGLVTATGGTYREGTNSLELRAVDVAGNTQAPLVWSVTVDTTPPTGTVTINADATMTTSAYVTLGLTASDAIAGVSRMLVSNEEFGSYVEEPFAASRQLWMLTPVRGVRRVYVKFKDAAGNVSAPVSDEIELGLLAPETVITSGPAGYRPERSVSFAFMCPEGGCVFSFAFDNEAWSDWNTATTATKVSLSYGNHYVRVKAAKEVNGVEGIQPDEEDPSPAQRMWVVGVEPSMFDIPKGPPIKVWRLE